MNMQYRNPNTSAAKWLFFGLVGIVILALLLGANIREATWLNPKIASAEANLMKIEAAHIQATYELQERLANAQTDAEIKAIQREQKLLDAQYEHDILTLSQDLEHREVAFRTLMTVLMYVGGALSIAIIIATVFLMVSWSITRVRAAGQSAKQNQDLQRRLTAIEKSIEEYSAINHDVFHRIECLSNTNVHALQKIDKLNERMKVIANSKSISQQEYDNLPLAE